MKATLSGRDTRSFMKLVVDGVTDRVVGCHIVGPDAGEMIQLVGIAVKMRATKADFDATMAVHPTAAEELVTMREKAASHVRAGRRIAADSALSAALAVGRRTAAARWRIRCRLLVYKARSQHRNCGAECAMAERWTPR